jgi:hypothetical protein
MKVRATLVSAFAEFSDMVDTSGTLYIGKELGWFNGAGSLEFRRKSVARKGNLIRIKTDLGNTFIFEVNNKRDVDDVLHELQDAAEVLKLMGYGEASGKILDVVEQVASAAGV